MLKNGYWLFEYLPISRIIINAPVRYGAYLYTETDGGDLTYFNHYHLQVVIRAIDDLHEYLEGQQRQLNEADRLLERFTDLNYRQRRVSPGTRTQAIGTPCENTKEIGFVTTWHARTRPNWNSWASWSNSNGQRAAKNGCIGRRMT